MGDSLLFQASLGDAAAPDAAVLHDAAASAFEVDELDEDEDVVTFSADREELSALVGAGGPGVWWVDADEDQLRYSDGRPDEETQASYVHLVRVLLVAAPPYVGLAVYPFGPEAPPDMPSSPPFSLSEVGPMLFVSERYLGDNPPAGDLREAVGFRAENVAGGMLLWLEGDLLQTAEDGGFNDLRLRLGLAGAT